MMPWLKKVVKAQDDRLFYVSEAIRRGYTPEEIAELTKIDIFYLDKLLAHLWNWARIGALIHKI